MNNSLHAKNTNDAWRIADCIFPTDYEYDAFRSARAGYPVYYSTADGVTAWIDDLGNRLEVNAPDGTTTNIWIDNIPEISVESVMHVDDVRTVCIKHHFYTRGTVAAYDAMLTAVGEIREVTPEMLYRVALDIYEHSDPDEAGTVENVMFLLDREAVNRFYFIDEK